LDAAHADAVPDRELLARLARGDREALAPLVERHQRRLYRIALSYLRDADDALDAVQETFVKAFENAARFNPQAEVAPWLVRIAVNHSIDMYRKAKRRSARVAPLEEGDHDASLRTDLPSPEARALGLEIGERIRSALDGLPSTQKSVFVLRHYHELSLEEIATTLGISLGTVKSSLHRAVYRLRGELGEVRS
jgi:RNA polymerase sigma-70 factor (ECF subfamily)